MKFFLPIILSLHVLLSSVQVSAQVQVRAYASPEKILIGEPIRLTMEAYIPVGGKVEWFKLNEIPGFEILDTLPIDTIRTIESIRLLQEYIISSYDSGIQVIPPFFLEVDAQQYYTDSIRITVEYAEFNSAEDYRDIAGIITIPHPYAKYIPWAIGLATLISLALLIYYIKKKKQLVEPVSSVVQNKTAYQQAVESLQNLNPDLADSNEVNAFYIKLNDILKTYISAALSISTSEKTNRQVLAAFQMNFSDNIAYQQLNEALRLADSVKFARYLPDSALNRESIDKVREAIERINRRSS